MWRAGEKYTSAGDAVQTARDEFAQNYPDASAEEKEQFARAIDALSSLVELMDETKTIKARAQGHIRDLKDPDDRSGTFISVTVAEHVSGSG
jgi:vacuolar-type H+-ATPase subunit H